jgi:apolipoprotein N-acyltransferase
MMPILPAGVSQREVSWTIAAGLAGAAAFPPLGLWPLILVSVVVFLRVLRGHSAAEARTLGLLYGVTYALGTMYWLFGLFGWLAISFVALMGGYFGLLATVIGLTRGRSILVRALLIALAAVAIEWLRGDAWYLRFPWYTPPHALAAAPAWIAPAHWVGSYGLSFLVWLIAAAVAFGRPVFVLAFGLLPAAALPLPPVSTPDRTAVLVQVEEPHPVEALLAEVPEEATDLIVLPEYAFPFGLEPALASKRGPAALARRLSCPVVFGTVEGGGYGAPGFQNVAAVLSNDGALLGTFPKQRPVPLMLDGRAGQRRPVFPLDQGILGIGICYDLDAPAVAASLVRAGATVLVAPTGDLLTWGRIQHLHHEGPHRLRAVENDRWLLRAVSSGRTEVIDPHGVPSPEGIEIGETGLLRTAFAHRTTKAPGSYLSALGPVAALLTAGFVVLSLRRTTNDTRNTKTETKADHLGQTAAHERESRA